MKSRFDAELTLGLLLDSKPQAQAQSQPMAQPQFQAQPSASKKQANVNTYYIRNLYYILDYQVPSKSWTGLLAESAMSLPFELQTLK